MLVLVSYDVSTKTENGQTRLRKLAKQCENYGIRVQNSVFECVLDAATWEMVKAKLIDIIDPQMDSLRFYYLGNKYTNKVEHVGTKVTIQPEQDILIL